MKATDVSSTFLKGLSVLQCFEAGQTSLTMTEIAKRTSFDRATTRRLCLSLVEAGYVRKTEIGLHLTPKALALAGGYLKAQDIGRAIQPLLTQFAEVLGGEISLAVRDGTQAIYVAQAAPSAARISIGFTVGSSLPLLPTAIGRMLLASATPEVFSAVLANPGPQRYTAETTLDADALRTQISDAARDDFAYVAGEFEAGAAGLAVPMGQLGSDEAVIGTTASTHRLSSEADRARMLDILRDAARAIGRQNG